MASRRLGADSSEQPAAEAPPKGRIWLWALLGLGLAGAGVWWVMSRRKKRIGAGRQALAARAMGKGRPPVPEEALERPEVPTPPPPLPPAPASQGNPATVEFWEQPPPPGRETVGPTEPLPSGTDYTFKAGESWSNVAERTYGNMRWWPFIFDANRLKFPNPDTVKVGDTIFVPDAQRLPQELKDRYFARAEEHKRIWSAHRRSKLWGKSMPVLPASVLEPSVAA